MRNRAVLWNAVAVGLAISGLAGCAPPPPVSGAAAIDGAYGIPPGTVPASLVRPDGLMINGLLPPNPNDAS